MRLLERPRPPTHTCSTVGNGLRLAFSTDTYVVRPLFFPGGNIGELAVYGTVNDLAMSGAQPLALSTGFVLEEGLEMDVLGRIAAAMGAAASRAGVQLVTGDTKVVEHGHGDGVYINTAGIGLLAEGVDIRPERARPGDVVIVSGEIGLHGIAVLSLREGLEFGTELRSDTAPLNHLVAAMLAACADIHVLRDPTRGGLAASLCEIAETAQVGHRVRRAIAAGAGGGARRMRVPGTRPDPRGERGQARRLRRARPRRGRAGRDDRHRSRQQSHRDRSGRGRASRRGRGPHRSRLDQDRGSPARRAAPAHLLKR